MKKFEVYSLYATQYCIYKQADQYIHCKELWQKSILTS